MESLYCVGQCLAMCKVLGRHPTRVEVSVKTGGSLERANIELVGVFERNLRFVRYWFCHLIDSFLKSGHVTIIVANLQMANAPRRNCDAVHVGIVRASSTRRGQTAIRTPEGVRPRRPLARAPA
jgi:hypothetical protein